MKRAILLGGAAVVGVLVLLLALVPVLLGSMFSTAKQASSETSIAEICAAGDAGQAQIPEEYREDIANAATVSGLSQEVLASQIYQESRWNPDATSPTGAKGLAQFKDDTWPSFGAGGDPYNGHDAIAAQARFHAFMRAEFKHLAKDDEHLVKMMLAGYRIGYPSVLRAGGVPDHPDVEVYLREILARSVVYTTECIPTEGVGKIGSGQWVNPLPGSVVTSPFGPRPCPPAPARCTASARNHSGLDLGTSSRAGTVVANTDMKITRISSVPSTGYEVVAQDLEDPTITYAFFHCATGSHRVTVGQTVAAGTPLCTEGMNGNASGPHLHFMVLVNNTPVDPEPILLANGVELEYL